MEISDLVLAHFQQVLSDLKAEAEARQGKHDWGTPPSVLVVEQRQPSSHADFNTGMTIRRWRVAVSTVTAMTIDEELPTANRVGMYYDYGKADFAISADATSVRIGWQVGPRYGRGYDLPLEYVEGAPVRFGARKELWVS